MERPPSKRQKVLIACEPCRNRKAKCDGVSPVCGPCGRRASKTGISCTWCSTGPSYASDTHVQALQERIAFLESKLKHTVPDGSSDMPAPGNAMPPRTSLSSPSQRQWERPAYSPPKLVRQSDEESPVYTIIGPTESNENREGFFGSSTAGTFMQNVRALVEQRLRGKGPESRLLMQQPNSGGLQSCFPSRRPLRIDSGEHSLPLRKTADELMSVYWQAIHPIMPILDRKQTQGQYEYLWAGDDDATDQASFLCLLNAIFAISSQLNPAVEPQDRVHYAARYYARAMNLLDVWQTASLRTVQSLILLAMYCQSSNEAHRCWILAGMSIRVSQALGIHLAGVSERAHDIRTRELLRRVWHGCVQLDRTVSMTYGRPCGVGERLATAVPLPSPAHCEEADITSTDIDLFNLFIMLFRNLHEIMYSLCAPGVIQAQSLDELYDRYFRHCPTDPNKPSVIDIEGNLQRWHDNIPNSLKIETFQIASEEPGLRRYSVVLEQNYLHIRLLLLRPFLSAVIALDPMCPTDKAAGAASLAVSISLQCAVTCVKIAQDQIKLIGIHRSQKAGDVGLTATWWFDVLFIYTAATVLNASLLSPSIVEQLSEASILESWQRALTMLEDYVVFGEHLKRLVTTLRVLFDTVPKQYSEHRRFNQRRKQREDHHERRPARSTDSHRKMSGMDLRQDTALAAQASWTPLQATWDFDWNQPTDGLWDLGFDPLDLAWLTSLPADLLSP